MKTESWRDHPLWLKELPDLPPAGLITPYDTALFEAEANIRRHKNRERIRVLPVSEEMPEDAYYLESRGQETIVRGGFRGVLYGVYAALQDQILQQPVQEGLHKPGFSLRMLECWDNMDGSVERGYAGRSIWFDQDAFCYEPDRIRQLGRLLASTGINILCINNVNVHAPAQQLIGSLTKGAADFAEILRPFGVRLMLSVDFSMPMQEGLPTADPLDPETALWWKKTAERIYSVIPDFAGFLVKADSEHRPGPEAFGRTHAQGANMLADALAPYGGYVIWRAFVYNCMQDWRDTETDRPCAAYGLYHPLDGSFSDRVILQIKYGPFDFQVREPVSPLLLDMMHTETAVELQLAQEYTGQQIDLFAMPPLWREIFDQIGPDRIQRMHAVAAVSNLGRDSNWTGHPFAALNLYAFGRYAWDPDSDPAEVITRWIELTYLPEKDDAAKLLRLLLMSRQVYEKYTAPLGLCWMVNPGDHYGPNPLGYEFAAWGTYNRAGRDAVGIDRTAKGTNLTGQYPSPIQEIYDDPQTCPDQLLLFFHRLPYTFRMKDGRTLIQRIYDDHFEGYEEVLQMQKMLEELPLPETDREEARIRMERQRINAREWRDVINTFFFRLSGIQDAKGRKIYE